MLRREFVRAVVSVSIAPRLLLSQQVANPAPPPPAPVPWTQGLNPNTPLPHTEVVDGIAKTEQRFFTPVQMATLIRLCDVLMPPIGNKPGALQADTHSFLIFLSVVRRLLVRRRTPEAWTGWTQSHNRDTGRHLLRSTMVKRMRS